MNRSSRAFICFCAFACLAPWAQAQTADKPLVFIVPFAAGSATDSLARALGQDVTAETKQRVVVDNRPGASGIIGAQTAARAAPDGLTVLIATNTTHAANPHLFKQLPYDPVKDFTPVSGLAQGYQVMVVHPTVPAKSVMEFVALAKKMPGKLTFGEGSSSARVAVELFQQMAGVKLVHVPYKSNPPAMADLIGGHIGMMIVDIPTGMPQVRGGKVRALAVTSRERLSLAPELPTMSEAGVKGYEMTYWFAVYAPAKTPPEAVTRLNQVFTRAISGETVKGFFAKNALVPFSTTPAELGKFQTAETEKWGRIIRSAGITPE
jgi:tripartite-type tricarboxylate transporter receptor subunit TctC